MVGRRVAGEPLEHVIGWARFRGLRIAVDPGVFVPRRRTELLVREAVALEARHTADRGPRPRPAVVLDVCCGSGAVGVALMAALGPLELVAVDVDPAAAACARRNLGAAGTVYEGDLYEPLPVTLRCRVDLLVANAPYVPSEAVRLLPAEARSHEPLVALDGGADGLDVQRRIVAPAREWLAPGGHVLVETSEHQAPATADLLARQGLSPRVRRSRKQDATVVVARLARPGG